MHLCDGAWSISLRSTSQSCFLPPRNFLNPLTGPSLLECNPLSPTASPWLFWVCPPSPLGMVSPTPSFRPNGLPASLLRIASSNFSYNGISAPLPHPASPSPVSFFHCPTAAKVDTAEGLNPQVPASHPTPCFIAQAPPEAPWKTGITLPNYKPGVKGGEGGERWGGGPGV